MAGDNEQLKADLQTGATKFGTVASNLQTFKNDVENRMQILSPEEEEELYG